MKIAVTGASGFLGTALVSALTSNGHEVLRLVRRATMATDEATWNPGDGTVDDQALAGTGAIVHLAGAGIGDRRWTRARKTQILRSRVDGTGTIARAAARMDPQPAVLVSASAIGYYGDTGDQPVDEVGPKGSGFTSDVTQAWEQAAEPARTAGIRVVHPRSGLVMGRGGGAWSRMLPLFRLGLGGRLGTGTQYWSYITLADEIRALQFLIEQPLLAGPVNLTAPQPATNAQITAAMGRTLHRPEVLAVPAFALRIALGEFSSEVLSSARVIPAKLAGSGFTWTHPTLEAAVATLV